MGIILGGFSLFALLFVFISWKRRSPRSKQDKREPDYNTRDSDLWFRLNHSLKSGSSREKARDKRLIGWPTPWRRAHRSALSNSASESPNPPATRPRGYTGMLNFPRLEPGFKNKEMSTDFHAVRSRLGIRPIRSTGSPRRPGHTIGSLLQGYRSSSQYGTATAAGWNFADP